MTVSTKHISIKHYHFRSLVVEKKINIHHTDSKNQLVDILSKPLDNPTFFNLYKIIIGFSAHLLDIKSGHMLKLCYLT